MRSQARSVSADADASPLVDPVLAQPDKATAQARNKIFVNARIASPLSARRSPGAGVCVHGRRREVAAPRPPRLRA
jgi:hypothetical protein